MEKYKAIIVDDEPKAQEILDELLNDFPEIQVVSKEYNSEDAILSIQKHLPDIVFLDIEMPGKDGLYLAQQIHYKNIETTIIFISANNQQAIEAFKVAAFDYLLKPIIKEELAKTIQRFKSQIPKIKPTEKIDQLFQFLNTEKICFNTKNGQVLINPKEIVYCKAEGNSTRLSLENESKEIINQNIDVVEGKLMNQDFIRINKTALINTSFVSSINRVSRKIQLTTIFNVIDFGFSKSVYEKIKHL